MEIPGITFLARAGIGGMSTVWKAREDATGRIVAVKILRPELSADADEVENLRAESELMQEIHHPCIVEGYGFGFRDGRAYMLMEFMDGYTFREFLARRARMRESDILLIIESVASALASAWQDHAIVHCDIKPENIMINHIGAVKLTDLGICHRYEGVPEGSMPVPDSIVGTPAYISPEQIYGDIEPDLRSDIYSLGATAYHLATGHTLFPFAETDMILRAHCADNMHADDARRERPDLSIGFSRLLEAMLVKDRALRLQTWQEVYDMATALDSGNGIERRGAGLPASMLADR